MKRYILTMLMSTAVICSCKSDTLEVKTIIKQTEIIDIISDKQFSKGISLLGLSSSNSAPIDQLYPFAKTNGEPVWKAAQWGSRFNLLGVTPEVKNDSVIYKNEGKKLSFLKVGDEVLVNMEVYGSKEYRAPRKEGEEWPHLLLEQGTNQVKLVNLKTLNYSISAKLMFAENKMGADYNAGMHTAQINLYLLVQNLNKQSAGYGDFFWFGLPLYDYRYRDMAEYAAQDLGKEDATKKFIFAVAAKTLFEGSLHDKNWVSISKDIYPQVIAAFNRAKATGYLATTNLADLGISSTNVGWEVPGTFDCGIQFKGLKLTAVANK